MSQYVYFTVESQTMTADGIASQLGVLPDRTSAVVSNATSLQPRPNRHRWSIYCTDTDQRMDAQAAAVLWRIEPAASKVRRLVDDGDVEAGLVFVRYFNDAEGQEEALEPVRATGGLVLDAIPGQHQLLGWSLRPEHLALLASMRAWIDADEFG